MIPRAIHYCWFGGKPLPKNVKKCISSWRKYCPDYEIKRWDENNFSVDSNEFIREAYKNKAWAFVSDYARLKIIYENGGIYLDTDVELLKNLDGLLEYDAYFGTQQDGNYVNTGLGFGGKAGEKTIKKLLDSYNTIVFDKRCLSDLACPVVNTKVFERIGFERKPKTQELSKNIVVFSPEYFDPVAPGNSKKLLTDNSYSIHHYDATWTSPINQVKRRTMNFIGLKNTDKIKKLLGGSK